MIITKEKTFYTKNLTAPDGIPVYYKNKVEWYDRYMCWTNKWESSDGNNGKDELDDLGFRADNWQDITLEKFLKCLCESEEHPIFEVPSNEDEYERHKSIESL